MDILQQQYNNNKSDKSDVQKIILKLIILSITIFIILLGILAYLQIKPKEIILSMFINGEKATTISSALIYKDENGETYISLKELSELLNYKYNNGEFLNFSENVEDKTKCYIEYSGQIVGLEQNSNKIYKTSENLELDYKYFTLKNKIVNNNNYLYISLEDLGTALDLFESYSAKENVITIKTLEYFSDEYKKGIEEKTKYKVDISNRLNNLTLLQNLIVISDDSSVGVVNANFETIIGMKYKDILYEDYCGDFIALNLNNKYGILTKDVKVKISFEYDSIEVLNYNPLLYKVKQNNLYGILDEKGKEVIPVEYTNFGFSADTSNGTEQVLLIDNINDKGIVVNKNGKYGIISIKTGENIIPCELSKIYLKTDKQTDKKQYYVEIGGNTYDMLEYIQYINTITVQM